MANADLILIDREIRSDAPISGRAGVATNGRDLAADWLQIQPPAIDDAIYDCGL
jgi:hypothetical protein